MNIESLTIAECREIAALFNNASKLPVAATTGSPFEIGKNYFIRTVTHHYTGKLIEVWPMELVLIDAAWIADDGRFNEAVSKGSFSDVEPMPDGRRVIIGRGSIIDAECINCSLPRVVK